MARDHTYQILNDIFSERIRQEEGEGFTSEGDDRHDMGELARAAAGYALYAAAMGMPPGLPTLREICRNRARLVFPDALGKLKEHGTRRALVIACALGMAEIERLDRANGFHYPLDQQERLFSRARAAIDAAFPPGRAP